MNSGIGHGGRVWMLVLVPALVVASCGEDAEQDAARTRDDDAAALIAAAPGALDVVDSFTFSSRSESTGSMGAGTAEVVGRIDAGNQRGLFEFSQRFEDRVMAYTMIGEAYGDGGGGRALYLVPEANRDRTGGRAWIAKEDPGLASDALTFDGHARFLADHVENGATVEERGEEEINGVPTTRYRIDKSVTSSTDGAGGTETTGSFHGDAWLTDEGVPIKVVYEAGLEGTIQSVEAEITDINQPVDIPRPSEDDIHPIGPDEDISDYLT